VYVMNLTTASIRTAVFCTYRPRVFCMVTHLWHPETYILPLSWAVVTKVH
jgi:hypothetical protein